MEQTITNGSEETGSTKLNTTSNKYSVIAALSNLAKFETEDSETISNIDEYKKSTKKLLNSLLKLLEENIEYQQYLEGEARKADEKEHDYDNIKKELSSTKAELESLKTEHEKLQKLRQVELEAVGRMFSKLNTRIKELNGNFGDEG